MNYIETLAARAKAAKAIHKALEKLPDAERAKVLAEMAEEYGKPEHAKK